MGFRYPLAMLWGQKRVGAFLASVHDIKTKFREVSCRVGLSRDDVVFRDSHIRRHANSCEVLRSYPR